MLDLKTQQKRGDGTAMSKLQLSFACALYDRMLALYTGEVKPDGCTVVRAERSIHGVGDERGGVPAGQEEQRLGACQPRHQG